MLKTGLVDGLEQELDDLREAGTYKVEHELEGPQGPKVKVEGRSVVLEFIGHEDPTCGGFSELTVGVTR